jgi:hypothetical protein
LYLEIFETLLPTIGSLFQLNGWNRRAVTDELVNRYRNLARGEVGLIIPGYLYAHPRGKAIGRQTGIHHDKLVAIDDGEVLSGSLPASKMKLVQAWIEIHKEDLMADWKLAVAGEPVFKIDPLR